MFLLGSSQFLNSKWQQEGQAAPQYQSRYYYEVAMYSLTGTLLNYVTNLRAGRIGRLSLGWPAIYVIR